MAFLTTLKEICKRKGSHAKALMLSASQPYNLPSNHTSANASLHEYDTSTEPFLHALWNLRQS